MREELLAWIRGLLLEAAASGNKLITAFFYELATDPGFREGFLTALVLGLFVGTASRYILFWRRQIQAFFSPPTIVLSSRGPTPAQSYASCIAAAAKIGLVTVFILVLLIAMLTERFTS